MAHSEVVIHLSTSWQLENDQKQKTGSWQWSLVRLTNINKKDKRQAMERR